MDVGGAPTNGCGWGSAERDLFPVSASAQFDRRVVNDPREHVLSV